VLFRGNAEGLIRKSLVRRGLIQAIIGLPANLFYGTGIPACIVVIDKAGAATRQGIFMVDASQGYMKDGPKNRLRERDLHRIVDAVTRLDSSQPRYARLVSWGEIERNDCNLNLPRYIDSSTPEDPQDIDAHLNGGIPQADVDALAPYWAVCPALKGALFEPLRPGYLALRVPGSAVKATIHGHPEFRAFTQAMAAHFEAWRAAVTPRLKALQPGLQPKRLIVELAEGLLAALPAATRGRRAGGPVCHLPARHGLLGRDDAGRRLPAGRRRLEGRDPPCAGNQEGQGRPARQDSRPRLGLRPGAQGAAGAGALCGRAVPSAPRPASA
jgi:type I restriction enzyme M protein